jgi:hypothetical protein
VEEDALLMLKELLECFEQPGKSFAVFISCWNRLGVMLRGDDVSKVEIIGVYRRRLKLVCDEIEQRRVVPEGSWQGAERAFQHPGAGKRF